MRFNGHAIILALAFAVCAGCDQKPEHEAVDPPADAEADLAAMRDLYMSLQPTVADADGFIGADRCDSATFTALIGAAGATVNLRAAIDVDGRVLRRPLAYEACYPKHSASDNSKDEFVSVLLYGVVRKDRALLEHVFDYGSSHQWVMGRGPLSRTFLVTTLRGQFARAIKELGGREHNETKLDQLWVGGLSGFEAHLQVISILAYGATFGGITDVGLDRLREHHARQPRNPFFAALLWRYSGDEEARASAVAGLRDKKLFPHDRLPTSADRCEPWLVQRDAEIKTFVEQKIDLGNGWYRTERKLIDVAPNPDWLPCPDERRTHSGGDFLITEAVLTGSI